jgi:hypothetical protein
MLLVNVNLGRLPQFCMNTCAFYLNQLLSSVHGLNNSLLTIQLCFCACVVKNFPVQLQIEEITRRLQTGELGIPPVGERYYACMAFLGGLHLRWLT